MISRKRVQSLYEALARSDSATLLAALSPAVTWQEAAGSLYEGMHVGPNAVAAHVLARLARDWEHLTATPSEFFAAEDQVVVYGHYEGTHRITHRRFVASFAHLWTLDSAGQILAFRQFTDTNAMRNAASVKPVEHDEGEA